MVKRAPEELVEKPKTNTDILSELERELKKWITPHKQLKEEAGKYGYKWTRRKYVAIEGKFTNKDHFLIRWAEQAMLASVLRHIKKLKAK